MAKYEKILSQTIVFLFSSLFFLLPFIFFPTTSELFEFNKIIFVYATTSLITTLWMSKMIIQKSFIFKKTFLDIPLLAFFSSQILSTLFSIDPYTSFWGYYSRFNGGLASTISFILLYWAFVSNIKKGQVVNIIKISLIPLFIISLWGILEHFGKSPSCLILVNDFSADCFVQDLRSRVFATFGQPNWLAAWITLFSPLSWAMLLRQKPSSKSYFFYLCLSLFSFMALLFTKSRSGILGFAISFVVFWSFLLIRQKNLLKKDFLLITTILLTASFVFGTPWSAPFFKSTETINSNEVEKQSSPTPALESGGTESGVIRKIVWSGAFDLWKKYPLFGTGVETFAYSYYETRPVSHNQTSEWDYIYNKAHNEYLNFAATSGTFGILSYLSIILVFLYFSFKKTKDSDPLLFALPAGFCGLLVANFFGFSTVVTSLFFFMYPAFFVALTSQKIPESLPKNKLKGEKLSALQIFCLTAVSLSLLFVLFTLILYFRADTLYKSGKDFNESGKYAEGAKALMGAVSIRPKEAVYRDTLSYSYSQLALSFFEEGEIDLAKKLAEGAVDESYGAALLSPRNVNLKKSQSNLFVDLSVIDPSFAAESVKVLQKLLVLAPTDAQTYHKMGLSLALLNDTSGAISYLERAVSLKADYKRARQALAYIYKTNGEIKKAREHLLYILENISPEDTLIQEELKNLDKEK